MRGREEGVGGMCGGRRERNRAKCGERVARVQKEILQRRRRCCVDERSLGETTNGPMAANGPSDVLNDGKAFWVTIVESDNDRRSSGIEGTKEDVAGKPRPAKSFWELIFELSTDPTLSNP